MPVTYQQKTKELEVVVMRGEKKMAQVVFYSFLWT